MIITPAAVAAFKECITHPSNHGLSITPITDFFIPGEVVIPKHILARAYMDHINKPIPKLVLYIIMDEIYGVCTEKAADGCLGYRLKMNE